MLNETTEEISNDVSPLANNDPPNEPNERVEDTASYQIDNPTSQEAITIKNEMRNKRQLSKSPEHSGKKKTHRRQKRGMMGKKMSPH